MDVKLKKDIQGCTEKCVAICRSSLQWTVGHHILLSNLCKEISNPLRTGHFLREKMRDSKLQSCELSVCRRVEVTNQVQSPMKVCISLVFMMLLMLVIRQFRAMDEHSLLPPLYPPYLLASFNTRLLSC